ncbi:24205_t:CDS:2, partial [Cetraspora pellucida]
GNNLQGWLLAIASGFACCIGASAVFSNFFIPKLKGIKHKQNLDFMVASFALGSGVLVPLNFVDNLNEDSPLLKNHLDERTDDISKNSYCNIQDFNEANSSDRHAVFVVDSDTDEPAIPSAHGHCDRDFHHHHDLQNPHSRSDQENAKLMQIGIQTALAISIHKFPEGLITFVSSQVSRSLGFALFAAIALHNIIEGLTIALPIYIATRSRIKAFLYASILGGLSQPLGALVGWIFLNESFFGCWNHNFIYGALFAATSGLMTVISINGMLPQAIKHDTKDGQI